VFKPKNLHCAQQLRGNTMTNAINNTNVTVEDIQAGMINNYMAQEFEMVTVHELFGLSQPLKGLEAPIPVAKNRHPLAPKIQDGYVFNENLLRRTMLSMLTRDSIMLVGDKGTGKSSFVQQLNAHLNRPLLTITAGPGVDESYLLGCKTIEDGQVKAVDGVLSYAYRHGLTCLIDEICTLRPGVLVSVNDILQGDEVVTLKHHGINPELDPRTLLGMGNGMTLVRHPAFRLFASDNTGGKQQKDGRFSGVNTHNSAVRSRFTSMKVGFMPVDKEILALANSLKGRVVDVTHIQMMVEFAVRFRTAFEQGEAFDNISFRELLRWARKMEIYGCIHESFQDAVYGNLEMSDQVLATNLFEETFGQELILDDSYSMSCADQLDAIKAITAAAA
jgi:cobaltochelatase CobS